MKNDYPVRLQAVLAGKMQMNNNDVCAGGEAVRAVKHTTTLTASALDAIWGSFLHHPSNVLNQYHL